MTTTTFETTRPSALRRLGRYLGDLARLLGAAREAEHLMTLSDAQLQRRGLRRDEIVSRAFAPYFRRA